MNYLLSTDAVCLLPIIMSRNATLKYSCDNLFPLNFLLIHMVFATFFYNYVKKWLSFIHNCNFLPLDSLWTGFCVNGFAGKTFNI